MKNIEFNTIKQCVEAEIIEKKSRFIANIFYVESKNEAEEMLAKTKKKYYDAKHNCYAYSILENETCYKKCSDDGEPSGTAGEPILNIIEKNNFKNVLIVVTRYFGGIFLGTGGLCRAYSEATVSAINKAKIIKMQSGWLLEIVINYEDNAIFRNYCERNKINVVSCKYQENITYNIELNDEEYEKMQKAITEKKILKGRENKDIKEICRKYVEKQE